MVITIHMVVSAVTPSPTVIHSPVMMGGVNVAAAVAIPVVLVLLLLLVIGVVVGVVGYYKNYPKGLELIVRFLQKFPNFFKIFQL